jgi:hypothetical protein
MPAGVHFGPKPVCPPVEIVAAYCFKGQPSGLHPLDHLPAQLDLGLEAPLGGNPQALTLLRHFAGKPALGQEQLAVHPRPGMPLGKSQEHPYLTQVHLTQASVVLSRGSCCFSTCLGIRTLVQQHHPTTAQLRGRRNLGLDLTIDGLSRPRRVRHEVLDIPTRLTGGTPNTSVVSLLRHTQQSTQIVIRVRRLISRLGPETVPKTGPKAHQTVCQACNGLRGHSPTGRIQYRLSLVFFVIRLLITQLCKSIKCAIQCS